MAPEARREQIVNAAVHTTARLGIANTRHSHVAAEAEIAIPTVFRYLPSRRDLVDAVLQTVAGYLVNMVEEAAATAADTHGKLLAVVNAFARTIDDDADYIRIFLDWGASISEETWPSYVVFQDRILDRLESIVIHGQECGDVPAGVNAWWAAHLIMGSGNIIAQMKFRERSADEIAGFLEALVHGALSPSRPAGKARSE